MFLCMFLCFFVFNACVRVHLGLLCTTNDRLHLAALRQGSEGC